MPSAAKTEAKALLNLESRSRSTNLRVVTRSARVDQQVAGGLGGPRPTRVCAHPEQMRSAGAMLDPAQDVDPPERDGVYVQKVHGEDGLGLCGEELAPDGA